MIFSTLVFFLIHVDLFSSLRAIPSIAFSIDLFGILCLYFSDYINDHVLETYVIAGIIQLFIL